MQLLQPALTYLSNACYFPHILIVFDKTNWLKAHCGLSLDYSFPKSSSISCFNFHIL
jgi:hypothetical protein